MDVVRAVLTFGVAVAVLGLGDGLPPPTTWPRSRAPAPASTSSCWWPASCSGCAEVLRDNSAQTILPAIVPAEHLERANGRMWSAEEAANAFVGPPLGSLLLAVSFVLPFVFDAAIVRRRRRPVFLVAGTFRAARPTAEGSQPEPAASWTADLKEGVRWLWHHSLLRTMAIVLGVLNAVGMMQIGILVLFAQEVLHTSPSSSPSSTMGGAVGGVAGGYLAAPVIATTRQRPRLWLTSRARRHRARRDRADLDVAVVVVAFAVFGLALG